MNMSVRLYHVETRGLTQRLERGLSFIALKCRNGMEWNGMEWNGMEWENGFENRAFQV